MPLAAVDFLGRIETARAASVVLTDRQSITPAEGLARVRPLREFAATAQN